MQSNHDIELEIARGALLHLRREAAELSARIQMAERELRDAEERARRARAVGAR